MKRELIVVGCGKTGMNNEMLKTLSNIEKDFNVTIVDNIDGFDETPIKKISESPLLKLLDFDKPNITRAERRKQKRREQKTKRK